MSEIDLHRGQKADEIIKEVDLWLRAAIKHITFFLQANINEKDNLIMQEAFKAVLDHLNHYKQFYDYEIKKDE